jgi:nitroimidazol reductase NimA-like FMN-containing flavoprotein (pyridoxamine 5'-phosphate oxidase superfamily)
VPETGKERIDMTGDDERPPMREMRSAECWERIAQAPYGRIGTIAAGEMDIFPVNHVVDRHSIVFRTAPGTKLLALTIHRQVLFEVDGIDDDEAFSVVVKGDADEFEREGEVEEAERLGVSPWAPGERKRWVRVTPRDIQGRAFKLPRPSGR